MEWNRDVVDGEGVLTRAVVYHIVLQRLDAVGARLVATLQDLQLWRGEVGLDHLRVVLVVTHHGIAVHHLY